MKKIFVVMSTVLLMLGVGTSRSFATAPDASTQDEQVDINGTTNGYSSTGTVLPAIDNMNGTGTITITVLGTTCSVCFVDTLVDEEVGTAFWNEYATTSGAAGAQGGWTETWEAAYLNNSTGQIYTDAAGALADGLTNSNSTDKGLGGSNFSLSCTGLCNGDVAIALGADFDLTSTEEEVITVTASTTQPTSGFYIDQTNPQDVPPTGGQGQISNIYFTESAVEQPACVGNQCQPPPPPPGVTPEPSSWLLLATGLLASGMIGLRRRFSLRAASSKPLGVLAVSALALVAAPFAGAQTVNTVPEVPTNPAAPHTAYAGTSVVLGATFTGYNAADTYTYKWSFGDTTSGPVTSMTNSNDLSTTHTYSVEADGVTPATVGYTWTAVLTVIDNTASVQYTGNYLVIWENNTLSSRVNVAIDKGLWYLHQAMYHPGAPTVSGWWDNNCATGYSYQTGGCGIGSNYGSLDATNVQAFEVNGHLATGPASDPYTSDVAEGLTRMLNFLTYSTNAANTVTYNPALYNFGCSDGTAPTTTLSAFPSTPSSPAQGYCDAGAVEVYYTPNSTSCTSPSCSFTFDGNSDGYMIYAPNYNNMGYEQGMYIDALVASTTPNATAPGTASGPIAGMTYQNIVQDMVDWTNYCQYGSEVYDVENGWARGQEPYEGGGWWYSCHQGGDNSVSQWASIGLIAANRGFGVTIPPIVTDLNNYWVTLSQDVQQAKPTGLYSYSSNDDYGAFGYNGSLDYSNAWGSFAVTPSGMVQMSLDGIGRTSNSAFGGSNAPDQRFNNAETYYADNFCNAPADGPVTSPRAYTYGMFSFTKAMLLHNPGGVLTPIQYLRSQTSNTFTGDSSDPANTIDWYAALSPSNGGTDACDGIAQTLLSRQLSEGSWTSYGPTTPYQADYNGDQYYYETAWAIIMLQKTVFVNCVNNLVGAGTMGNAKTPARIDLTWTGIPNVTGYNVLISSTTGGPYTQVPYNGGTTTGTAFSDRSGLTNGNTYYFVLQPVNGGGAVCQSNQATVTVP
jgi:hypothetical protein